METQMRGMLLARGYEGMVRYRGNEIEIGFNLDDEVVMTLNYSVTVAPTSAVAKAVSMLDKLNGIKR
jgi:hypothetical protein